MEKSGADIELINLAKECLADNKENRPNNAGEVAQRVTEYQHGMQKRLQQAEIDKAKAVVQVEEERKRLRVEQARTQEEMERRKAEEGRAREELRRRHWTLATAGVVVLFLVLVLIAVAGGGYWYRQAEIHRISKELRRKTKISEALKQGKSLSDELNADLKKKNGVSKMLNQPEEWLARIMAAWSRWQSADDLRLASTTPLGKELEDRLLNLHKQIQVQESDRKLALRLEKVRNDKAAWIEGDFNDERALQDYDEEFKKIGVDVLNGQVPKRLLQSAIRQHLAACMRHWALTLLLEKADEKRPGLAKLRPRLLDLAKRLDPDGSENQLLESEMWNDRKKLVAQLERLKKTPNGNKLAPSRSPQSYEIPGYLLHKSGCDAEECLRLGQSNHPTDYWLAFDLANVLFKKERWLEAAGYYRTAIALRPQSLPALNNLGNALYKNNDLDRAIDTYKRAIGINPNFRNAFHNLGIALSKKMDTDGAIAAYSKAIEIDGTFVKAIVNMGNVFKSSRLLDKAVTQYNKAIEIDPRFAAAHLNLGIALSLKSDLVGALAEFEKAIEIDSDLSQAHFNMSNCLIKKNDLNAAIRAYKRAIQIDPKYTKAYTNLGICLNKRNDIDGAIAEYNKAIKIAPRFTEAHYNLGIALDNKNNRDGAIRAYKKAVQFDPNFAKAFVNLGNALVENKEIDSAIIALNTAKEINPKDWRVHVILGNAFLKRKNWG